MAGEIEITLHQEFAQELKKLADMLRAWDKSCLDGIIKALKIIGQRWKAEAVKRVPVDTGNLKNRILTDTYKEAATGQRQLAPMCHTESGSSSARNTSLVVASWHSVTELRSMTLKRLKTGQQSLDRPLHLD